MAAVLDIKGVRIGVGRPKTIISLMDESEATLLEHARRAIMAGADCLEWRVDGFDAAEDLPAVVRACRALTAALPATPLIATFRSASQGGCRDLSLAVYRALNDALITEGRPDLVDIELGAGEGMVSDLVKTARDCGVRAIVSHHDFARTPDVAWMCDCLLREERLGADIAKLAVMAESPADALRLMEASTLARAQASVPLLTMAMGANGALSRLAGEVSGSAMTFCALGESSAPGQVELDQAIASMEALHEALQR